MRSIPGLGFQRILVAGAAFALCGGWCLADAGKAGGVWRVDRWSPASVPDGQSWGMAYNTIQAAIDAAFLGGGGEVWVKEGRYDEQRTSVVGGIDRKSVV